MHHQRPRPCLALLAGLLLALAVPAAALAHPLGNFTINHYSGIRVSPDRIVLDQVFDLAEIPALQALQPTGGDFGPGGPTAFAAGECGDLVSGLMLTFDGARLDLALSAAGASLPPGQGGLSTLRLVCTYVATAPAAATSQAAISFHDGTYAERIGWREIVVQGDGVAVSGVGVTAEDVSARLTDYPTDLLAQPLDRSKVSFSVAPGGPRLPPLVVADASPLAAAASGSSPSSGGPTRSVRGATAASSSASASVPGGVSELPAALTTLLHSDALSPGLLALGLLVAVGLGALHALTPGHGKTIMAAYLVGTRGDTRQAVGLGATVATSHTIGVLVLAMLVLAASSILPPERLFPVLSAVSAILVTGIGGWLLIDAWRRIRSRRPHGRAEGHLHAYAHGEVHEHVHVDAHDHVHAPAAAETHHHADGHAAEHSHGGRRHSHLPPARTDGPIRWRGIVTLGLAGGLVPSASAILLLLAAVAAGRPLLGLGLVIAFGLGMASVLGAIGLVLVRARSLADRLPSMAADGRLGLMTSLAAATVVLGFGLLLVSQSLTALPF